MLLSGLFPALNASVNNIHHREGSTIHCQLFTTPDPLIRTLQESQKRKPSLFSSTDPIGELICIYLV